MILEEVKATLAMENLELTSEQEVLLKRYIAGEITLQEYQAQIKELIDNSKVA
ncbi:MAG: antitoxin VbhA family protein [Succinivibrio sp.]|nr:antitoxin VbhA family protein [Succinivibrio sp.]